MSTFDGVGFGGDTLLEKWAEHYRLPPGRITPHAVHLSRLVLDPASRPAAVHAAVAQVLSLLCRSVLQKLTDEVFRSCLESGDYMQMKNALLVLNRCVKVRSREEMCMYLWAPVYTV